MYLCSIMQESSFTHWKVLKWSDLWGILCLFIFGCFLRSPPTLCYTTLYLRGSGRRHLTYTSSSQRWAEPHSLYLSSPSLFLNQDTTAAMKQWRKQPSKQTLKGWRGWFRSSHIKIKGNHCGNWTPLIERRRYGLEYNTWGSKKGSRWSPSLWRCNRGARLRCLSYYQSCHSPSANLICAQILHHHS